MKVRGAPKDAIKVLLVEDDRDDCALVEDLLSEVSSTAYELTCLCEYTDALEALMSGSYAACLLDYRLGGYDGLSLLREATERGCEVPVIFLTGQGDHSVDVEAMEFGAIDYLAKNQISADVLDRSIRYSIKQRQTERSLREARDLLGMLVEERTAELAQTNEQLKLEIEERKNIESSLRESEERLRFLSSGLLRIQEDERCSLARELHDSIGQSMIAIKFRLEHLLHETVSRNLQELVTEFGNLIELIQLGIDETRRICSGLRPSIIDNLGVLASIRWLCEQFETTHPDVRIQRELQVREENVPDPLKIVIFRILQEALNNIAKHSRAQSVYVVFRELLDNSMELIIEDDGVGFEASAGSAGNVPGKGFGLLSMRERATLSGGAFSIESRPGLGTTVRASWPGKQLHEDSRRRGADLFNEKKETVEYFKGM